jgi:thiosulfate reductase cytochrome b subunit
MLAESLTFSAEAAASSPNALAWWGFVALGGAVVVAVPVFAALLRRQLPGAQRARPTLEPVAFGSSQKSLHSPRHAVRPHRTLITTVLVTLLTLLVLPGLAALRTVGLSALQVAIGLVLPTFVVALHARQRDSDR